MNRIITVAVAALPLISLLTGGCSPSVKQEGTAPPAETIQLPTSVTPENKPADTQPGQTANAPEKSPLDSYIKINGNAVTGSLITIDASNLEEILGNGLKYSWRQVFLPDKYSGVEYLTGNQVQISGASSSVISFTPQWPGNYRFSLSVAGGDSTEELDIDVPVRLQESPFDIRGISYDMWHYTDELSYMSGGFVKRAKESGANLIMLSPTLYMASATSNEMSPCPPGISDKPICRGAMKDEDLLKMIREAHAVGLQVMVKMILQVANTEGQWIEKNPSDWDKWFRNWTDVCLHYGEIAQSEGVEFFAVGSELRESAAFADKWRQLIGEVRGVYSGKLTYGDNSISSGLVYGDYGYFEAWDALDYIGVHFYGPVTGVYGSPEKNDPSVEEMSVAFEKYMEEILDPIVAKYDLPVIFMEFGTASYDGTNIAHFNYSQTLDNAEQSEYYEAGLQVLASRDYIEGVNIWAYTWEPFELSSHLTMNPIDKPAEEVIKLWFNAE